MRYTVHRTNKRGEYDPSKGREVVARSFYDAARQVAADIVTGAPMGRGTSFPGQRAFLVYGRTDGAQSVVVRSVYPCPDMRTPNLDHRGRFGVANSAGLIDIWETGPAFYSYRAASSAARIESRRGRLGDCWAVRFVYDPAAPDPTSAR